MNHVVYDYRFKFATADLALALGALSALREAGTLANGGLPDNMIGDPMDATGQPVPREGAAWFGRRGAAAVTFPDPGGGGDITVPQRGDPGSFYVHIRSIVAPGDLGLNPAEFGLIPTSVDESAIVLGVWSP